jgi:Laminin G domain
LRANALENNVNFYVYAGGRRSVLDEGQATVSAGQWHELRAEITGGRMTGYLDGKQVVASTDNRFGAGRIGLWTKADSVTCFDDVTATAR